MTKAYIFDIEGTITDIQFVSQVLFPYAKRYLEGFVRKNATTPEVQAALEAVRADMNAPQADLEDILAQLYEWMEADRKVGSLKLLQGMVWRAGYANGDYKGHLYPDVVPALQAYKAQGIQLYIYSSGSVEAQKLLLANSEFGDVTGLFDGYFDTTIGAKIAPESYINIAQNIGCAPADITFFSDYDNELAAAKSAGCIAIELNRGRYEMQGDIAPQGWRVIESLKSFP